MWTSLQTYLPAVKARVAPDEPFGVCLRLSAASASTLVREPGGARPAAGVPRRERHVRLHRERVPLRQLQGPADQGAGLRARLALRRAHAVHDERRHGARGDRPRGHRAVDPERPARIQGACDRRLGGRELHGARDARGRAPCRARGAHRHDGHARARARAAVLPRDDRRDDRVLHPPPLLGRRGRAAGRAREPAGRGGARSAAPPRRHRLRRLPPGDRVRGHGDVARGAARRRDPDLQAPAGLGDPRGVGGRRRRWTRSSATPTRST